MEAIIAERKVFMRRDGEGRRGGTEVGKRVARFESVAISFVAILATHDTEEGFLVG